jgi:benzylsuccinate CoA-transferase BbsE subunit
LGNEKEKQNLLSRLRVLDLADEKASFCTRLLADMGAWVVKIEKPGGDPSRKVGPFRKDSKNNTISLSFYYNNINKLGVTLDLEKKEGKSLFLRLVEHTDVIVESFNPDFLEKIGLDFETLTKANPKIILASVTGFGQSGPRSHYTYCDLVASAFGGQMYVSGSPSKSPLKAFGEQSYIAASLFTATGILLALRKRAKTGKGEHLDISLQESVVATLEHILIRYFSGGVIPQRRGSLHWNNAFAILPCKNGSIHLMPFQQWETLIEWLGGEGMAEDLMDIKWRDENYRYANIEHVIGVLSRWTKTHTVEELFELGQLMRFPWAPIQTPMKVLNCAQLAARHFFVDTKDTITRASLKCPSAPYKCSNTGEYYMKAAPLPGEDNVFVYQTGLGLSEEQIKQLSEKHVI